MKKSKRFKFRDWDGDVKPTGMDSVIGTIKKETYKCVVCGVSTGAKIADKCLSCNHDETTLLALPNEGFLLEVDIPNTEKFAVELN
jgi:hypothetical protein